jgi:type II secretory pathway component PulF
LTGRLEAGQSLSESLASHKEYFPPLYISMVEAGEKSGNLAEVLFQASNYYKTIDDFRKKITNVLIYPAMLTLLSVGVIIFLVKLMVPPYVDMYSGFNVDFPLSLKFLVSLEEFLRPNVFWLVIAPALLVGLIAFVFSARRNEAMRMRAGMAILKIPLWGRMIKEAILSRSIATLVILLRSGVPLSESLSIIRDLIANRPLKKAFESAAEQVSEGESLSQALLKQPVFPLEIAMVIRSGEARGELIDSLDGAIKMCEGNFEFSSRMILSVAEPALLVVLGVVVVSMAVSLFYPLYSLVTYLGT